MNFQVFTAFMRELRDFPMGWGKVTITSKTSIACGRFTVAFK